MGKLENENGALMQKGELATLEEHQGVLHILLSEFDRVCQKLGIRYFLFAGTMLGAVRHQDLIPWDDDLDVAMLREDYERFLREAPEVLDSGRFFLQKEFSEHWPIFFSKLRLNGTTCLEKYHPKDPLTHQGVYMDIFPLDHGVESMLGRKVQFFCSKVVIAKGLDKRGYFTNSRLKKLFMHCCRLVPTAPFLRIVKGPRKASGYLHSFLGGASKFERSVYPAECFAKSILLSLGERKFPVPEQYDTLLKILYDDYMRIPSEEERSVKQHALLVDLTRSYEYYEGFRDGMVFDNPTRSIR